ncbi:MAG TPA: hypothetical protein VLZ12_09970, partial [Verrucomicrobiae bacterium]|nr:hypothetical protein [Verrucomicrobiae bacterium]
MKPSLFCIAVISGVLITSSSVRLWADPLPGEKIKFYQLPLNNGAVPFLPGAVIPPGSVPAVSPGHDELSTAYRTGLGTNTYEGTYMADDFCDHRSSPVVHVVWWGSYMTGDCAGCVPRFLIAF